jgi:SAM-dependent methyltransferase
MATPDFTYVGSELDTFSLARNWKHYWSLVLAPYVSGTVLEVGAGIGANIPYLINGRVTRLVGLEPDRDLARRVEHDRHPAPNSPSPSIEIRHGGLSDLPLDERYDTIVYIDVLEHIARDGEEVRAAAARLRSGGHLVVLAPAFQALFSEFDRAVGHCRRYTATTLKALTPETLEVTNTRYLDSLGACLSAANRLVLRRSMPTTANILFWDRYVVPASRVFDHALGRFVGRSVVCIWKKKH